MLLLTGGLDVVAAAALEVLAPWVPEAAKFKARYSYRFSAVFPHVSEGYPGQESEQSLVSVDIPGTKSEHQHDLLWSIANAQSASHFPWHRPCD